MTMEKPIQQQGVNQQGVTQSTSVLTQIREGMDVYDRDNERIGTVDEVYFGEASDIQRAQGTGSATAPVDETTNENTFVGMIAEAFDPREVPDELAARLRRSGYIRLDSAGLFRSDRYIVPDQIASVIDQNVHLTTTRDELVKRR
jgi:hypothetical protein